MTNWQLNSNDRQLVALALNEDLGEPKIDLASTYLWANSASHSDQVNVVSKQSQAIILSGLAIVDAIMQAMNADYCLQAYFKDGDQVETGATLFTLSAHKNHLMMTERTILNFLQRMCAVATLTRQFVDRVKHTQLKILDTRKTLPGFRHLDKYAVQCGGGINHRMGLYDALMIKDNHIDLLGGIPSVLDKLDDDVLSRHPVIVEVRNPEELQQLLHYGTQKVSRVLLDNMSPSQLQQSVALCQGKVSTEASGNLTLETILDVANSGVNYASVGLITHSATAVDLSMRLANSHD